MALRLIVVTDANLNSTGWFKRTSARPLCYMEIDARQAVPEVTRLYKISHLHYETKSNVADYIRNFRDPFALD